MDDRQSCCRGSDGRRFLRSGNAPQYETSRRARVEAVSNAVRLVARRSYEKAPKNFSCPAAINPLFFHVILHPRAGSHSQLPSTDMRQQPRSRAHLQPSAEVSSQGGTFLAIRALRALRTNEPAVAPSRLAEQAEDLTALIVDARSYVASDDDGLVNKPDEVHQAADPMCLGTIGSGGSPLSCVTRQPSQNSSDCPTPFAETMRAVLARCGRQSVVFGDVGAAAAGFAIADAATGGQSGEGSSRAAGPRRRTRTLSERWPTVEEACAAAAAEVQAAAGRVEADGAGEGSAAAEGGIGVDSVATRKPTRKRKAEWRPQFSQELLGRLKEGRLAVEAPQAADVQAAEVQAAEVQVEEGAELEEGELEEGEILEETDRAVEAGRAEVQSEPDAEVQTQAAEKTRLTPEVKVKANREIEARQARMEYLQLMAEASRHIAEEDSRADKVLRKAIALEPSEPGAYDLLGTVLRSTGRYAEAVQSFLKAAARHPDGSRRWAWSRVQSSECTTAYSRLHLSQGLPLQPAPVLVAAHQAVQSAAQPAAVPIGIAWLAADPLRGALRRAAHKNVACEGWRARAASCGAVVPGTILGGHVGVASSSAPPLTSTSSPYAATTPDASAVVKSLPKGYVCRLCGVAGHWFFACPQVKVASADAAAHRPALGRAAPDEEMLHAVEVPMAAPAVNKQCSGCRKYLPRGDASSSREGNTACFSSTQWKKSIAKGGNNRRCKDCTGYDPDIVCSTFAFAAGTRELANLELQLSREQARCELRLQSMAATGEGGTADTGTTAAAAVVAVAAAAGAAAAATVAATGAGQGGDARGAVAAAGAAGVAAGATSAATSCNAQGSAVEAMREAAWRTQGNTAPRPRMPLPPPRPPRPPQGARA